MGKIAWAFASVPGDKDPRSPKEQQEGPPWTEVRFANIYGALAKFNYPPPPKPAKDITRAELIEHLQTAAGGIIKQTVQVTHASLFAGAVDNDEIARIFSQHRYEVLPPVVAGLPVRVSTDKLREAIRVSEMNALSADDKAQLDFYLAGDDINIAHPAVAADLDAWFPGSLTKRADKLQAAADKAVADVQADLAAKAMLTPDGEVHDVPAVAVKALPPTSATVSGGLLDAVFDEHAPKLQAQLNETISPLATVMNGFPCGPNALSADDVTGALSG